MLKLGLYYNKILEIGLFYNNTLELGLYYNIILGLGLNNYTINIKDKQDGKVYTVYMFILAISRPSLLVYLVYISFNTIYNIYT